MSEVEGPDAGGRQRLLSAARVLFADHGMEDVPVSSLLAKAGVRAPTLYYHFGDKDGLYEVWATGVLEELGAELRAAQAFPGGFRECLTAVAEALSRFRGCQVLQLVRDSSNLSDAGRRDRLAGAYLQSVHEPVCASLLRGVECGELAPEALGRMASTFVLGSICGQSGLPGAPSAVDAGWWVGRFLDGFGTNAASGRK